MADQLESLLRTSLYENHVAAGAKMVPFAGFKMPVQYAGVIEEHRRVRSAAGLFDVSHMGEIEIEGPGAGAYVQNLVTNNAARLEIGRVMYTVMCRESGGIVDDLTVYRRGERRYMAVVNAANIQKDLEWMSAQKAHDCTLRDVSGETGLLALQGPRAEAILSGLMPGGGDLGEIPFYWAREREVAGCRVLVSRTGYTGEDGFELYLAAADAPRLWGALLEAGAPEGLCPCGLGARDTLRTEMKYPLYGNDIDETANPLEAGLGWVVKFKAGDFIGREALLNIKEAGLARRLVGFEMIDRGIPRHGAEILAGGKVAGVVTSGTMGPSLGKAIGIGYVPVEYSKEGSEIAVSIRGTARAARVVKTPFYRKEES